MDVKPMMMMMMMMMNKHQKLHAVKKAVMKMDTKIKKYVFFLKYKEIKI